MSMDIATIEKVLKKSNVRYNILSGGIDIKFGFWIGSFFVKYDQANDTLVYGNKYRWLLYAIHIIALGYLTFFISYESPVHYFILFTFFCSLLSIVLKEKKIKEIKRKVAISHCYQN